MFPVHDVTIPQAFAVSKYEVTFEEWDACVAGGGCEGWSMHEHRADLRWGPVHPDDEGWGRGNRPVINVSWDHTHAYVEWLSQQTGQTYRLLTEAEWEYVARAGSQTAYSWGDDSGTNRANCYDDRCGDQWEYTAPVGSFPANAFGVHDMHGNVWEWVEDCWNYSYAGAPSDGSAWTSGECPPKTQRRVIRGGSWGSDTELLRSASRYYGWTNFEAQSYLGFRVARTL